MPSHRGAFQLQHLLTASASRLPERSAVRCAGASLDYAALDARSDSIAAHLHTLGVRRGDRVAVCLPKSVETIAVWFGVLKSGAAYVPIDPTAPLPRVRAIVEQGRPSVVVAEQGRDDLAALDQTVVVWDRPGLMPGPTLADRHAPWRPVDGTDTDLAYVYFTSGSTGVPKGVAISHRAALAYLQAADGILRVDPGDVVANHAPLAFDLASFDVHVAIRAGACVTLVPETAALMPGSMLNFLKDERPTILYTVPTTLHRLAALDSMRAASFPSLRALIFAGESPRVPALTVLQRALPNAWFHHWYGSTEAALVTACAFAPGQALPDPMPIGRAVANIELALDDEIAITRPLGPAAQGELLVSGTLLFDGYFGAPAADAEAFVETRRDGDLPVRWFRTRDVVRYLGAAANGGELQYIGRLDRMVKVRGYRVDLGDIERALIEGAGVRDGAVVAIDDDAVGTRLYAFVVGADLDLDDLHAHMAARLPVHMVPQHIVASDDPLPRTATGKIDRAALARRIEPGRGTAQSAGRT